MAKVGCGGKVGGCSWEEEQQQQQQQQQQQNEGLEMEEVESNASKRILWATQKRYISYESLKNDVVPCAKRGVPYYNCWAFPRAHNLYSRGCEIITACARDANP
ncbi:Protein RALF-like 31 [Ananas comosus]|nr:Protein RALF-like 31 [Ananas comosus]